jgi:uracil-DNA glycosylase family 4
MNARRITTESLRESSLAVLADEIVTCRRCPRLVAWREQVARERRAAFASEEYWGRPVPGFGDPAAALVILGLAPAAHGANRTGRVFTGDRSGDFLFAALWRTGLASQPTSRGREDGLTLRGAWITAAVRCAPPANRPAVDERENCLPFARRELDLLACAQVVLCLGAFAWDAALRIAAPGVRPRPRFAHGAELEGAAPHGAETEGAAPRRAEVEGAAPHSAEIEGAAPRRAVLAGAAPHGAETVGAAPRPALIASYHPSQQNTFTGRLTEAMLDAVIARALVLAGTACDADV